MKEINFPIKRSSEKKTTESIEKLLREIPFNLEKNVYKTTKVKENLNPFFYVTSIKNGTINRRFVFPESEKISNIIKTTVQELKKIQGVEIYVPNLSGPWKDLLKFYEELKNFRNNPNTQRIHEIIENIENLYSTSQNYYNETNLEGFVPKGRQNIQPEFFGGEIDYELISFLEELKQKIKEKNNNLELEELKRITGLAYDYSQTQISELIGKISGNKEIQEITNNPNTISCQLVFCNPSLIKNY